MIRITTATDSDGMTVTVEGQVASEYVETIDTCVKQALRRGRPVHLFLRDVSSIDQSGRGLLSRLAANGVQLSARGIYSSYVVEEISQSAAARNDAAKGNAPVSVGVSRPSAPLDPSRRRPSSRPSALTSYTAPLRSRHGG